MHEQIMRDLRQDSQSKPRSSSYTNRIELGTVIAEDEDSTNEATPERDPSINANRPERSVDRSSSRPIRSLDSPEQRTPENPRAFVKYRTLIDGKFDKDKISKQVPANRYSSRFGAFDASSALVAGGPSGGTVPLRLDIREVKSNLPRAAGNDGDSDQADYLEVPNTSVAVAILFQGSPVVGNEFSTSQLRC
ncbi:hypothetical protein B0J13DRAFT_530392 [Dactylonectria estremocensis]|uniref:Uncharacterized protein n=1 Tax=Dactylonectria estremocensis TaxID=1079267 RepID=A0A9P9IRA9_9HYPO|nr:hypothetical protein B0J13DRAFT_530392 [Dactylonectria estremocensis]